MKFLMNAKQDPLLEEYDTKALVARKQLQDKQKFLEKQMKQFVEDYKSHHTEYWETVKGRMRELGILTDKIYNKEKEMITRGENADFIIQNSDNSNAKEMIAKLLHNIMGEN